MAETPEQRQLREQDEAVTAAKKHDDETESRLAADAFVVVAPLVNIKVKSDAGGFVVRDHNEGAVVQKDNVDPANLRHLVDIRYLAPVGSDDARYAGPAGTPKPGEPPNVPVQEGTPVEMLPTQERLSRQQAAVADQKQTSRSRSSAKDS